jgi:hypothetical protein
VRVALAARAVDHTHAPLTVVVRPTDEVPDTAVAPMSGAMPVAASM